MFDIKVETDSDWWEVENLFDTCFGPGRGGLSSYQLRTKSDPVPELCLAARDSEGILAGATRCWPITIGKKPCLLFGPIGVHPTRQGEGLGALLIVKTLQIAEKNGWDHMLLVGDISYYKRFRFTPVTGINFPPPTNPNRILGCHLGHTGQEFCLTGLAEPAHPSTNF